MSAKDLPETFRPEQYDIHFIPALQKDSTGQYHFEGSETIMFRVLKPASEIVLHARGLTIDNVVVSSGESEQTIDSSLVRYDAKEQTVSIPLPYLVNPGPLSLSLHFSGNMKKGKGLYASNYKGRDGTDRVMATTQFEAAHAREAFPCLDHPAAKAKFNVSVTVDSDLEALSNASVFREIDFGNGTKMVYFEKTPPMSTYLLYLGVGEFDSISSSVNGVPLRVLTTPGKQEKGRFALEAAQKFLTFYEAYFAIPYSDSLPKLDHVAVPDFAFGAMENWGAITFREDALLCDPEKASSANKQRVVTILAHELAHMWFGNLVTMNWWDDLWLNESFADWLSYKTVDSFYPELDIWSTFMTDGVTAAYAQDSLSTSHPIHQPVDTPEDTEQLFDHISYSKGGMVLRMLEKYLGEEVFKQGLRQYLQRHKYGNAQGDDLWQAMEDVSGKLVKDLMESWISQIGYPLVDATLEGSTLRLTQQRFRYKRLDRETKWPIPLTITADGKTLDAILFTDEDQEIDLGMEPQRHLKLNAGQFGFFRVRYDPATLSQLKHAVETKELDVMDRWGLHSDQAALCLAGEISLSDYINFVEGYKNEDSYLVTKDVITSLEKIALLCSEESFVSRIHETQRTIYKSILDRLGWERQDGENETDGQLRADAIFGLGRLHDSDVIEGVNKLMSNRSSIHPDLRRAAYGIAVWSGGRERFEQMQQLYEQEEDPQERINLLRSLMGSSDGGIIDQALAYILTDKVKTQNKVYALANLIMNPQGRKHVWPWIQQHWPKIKETYADYHGHFRIILEYLSNAGDLIDAQEARTFLERDPILGTERHTLQLAEMLDINQAFLERARQNFAIP
ncbi:M1 family metallopeptidase [Candidatus Woesearchaeota archaeon]|nr:M1 family metallopeptidase [Candidatus Woesearchaeota archaeon]